MYILLLIILPPVNDAFVWAIFCYYKSPCFPVGSFRKRQQLTREQQRIICFQDVRAKISILVINTGPSETNHMRCRHVILEGCYQLFINSTLNSSCGSLKEKQIYVKKCIIFLAVNKLILWNKSERLKKIS